ncbi:MAG: hypothetical protein WBF79_01450 [Rhodococcus sp. (in: high G+C Gram-positive bacteria)]
MTFSPAPIPSPIAPLRAAVRYGILALIALAVVASVIAFLVAGADGLWGALLGSAVGGLFILATAVSVLLSAKMNPTAVGVVLLGGWIVKMLIAVIVLGVLRGMDFYHRPTLGIVVLAALVIVLGAEMYGIFRQRVPYVDSTAGDNTSDVE